MPAWVTASASVKPRLYLFAVGTAFRPVLSSGTHWELLAPAFLGIAAKYSFNWTSTQRINKENLAYSPILWEYSDLWPISFNLVHIPGSLRYCSVCQLNVVFTRGQSQLGMFTGWHKVQFSGVILLELETSRFVAQLYREEICGHVLNLSQGLRESHVVFEAWY